MNMVPKFNAPTGGAGTDYVFSLAQREWDRRPEVIGGYREAAVRTVRAARTISRTYMLDVVLRVRESEISMVETLVAWMQDNPNTAVEWWPDKDVALESFDVLLVAPMPGEGDLDFARSDVGGIREVTLTLIKDDGTAWDLEYYGDT